MRQTIVERHRVIAGVVWLDHAPIRSIAAVRMASDPEAVWITLRPIRDYGIVDAEGGSIYVSALVGTLVEVTYTHEDGPGTGARPGEPRALVAVVSSHQGAHQRPHGEYGRGSDQYRPISALGEA